MSQLEELLARKEKLEKRYNEKLKERERNSIECNRIESNECYFILKTKLFNITEANDIIEKDTSEGIRNIFQLDFEYFYSGEETVHDCYRMNFEDLGNHYSVKIRHAHVLAMEQIMSTGGGWQDQVGGITPGLKYITSMPGIDQQLKVTHIEIPEAAKKELDDRFVLIYTGQRRLARNLLRDVVGRYVGNEPDSLFALEEIQKTAALMRFELERGNVDGFAKLLDYHWELSKKVDAGSSNTLIEQIFSSIEELIDGKLVCGAGGGGFLQAILKKGVTRQQVEDRLNEVFMDSLVGVADCRLVWE